MSHAPSRGEPSSQRGGVSRKRSTAGSSRSDEKMIGQWRIGRTIGKGSSGRVKIAKHAITGKYAAIKIVPKGAIISSRMSVSEAGTRAEKVLLGIEREIVIMKLIDHPNVLNLYDVWETSSELYLIMEYVPGGELFDYLVKRGRLPVSEALHYFQQIIYAVDYCHRFNICHRDLKPENLLLDRDKNIKVADFGMAAWEAGERMLETSCGSPHYASPEIVAGKAYHGSSSDIWSCGIILFALLTGRLPFDDDNIRSLLQKVKTGVFEMPDEIKNPARDLLSKMLEKDPERRITMPDILQHPFFVSRPPRPIPGRALVSPPSLTEVERPVNSPDEIDDDIMGNLRTLWSGAPDDEIIAALMSKDKTWEKAIYHLLIKYRNKHLENYNMEDEDVARHARNGRKAHALSGPSTSPPKRKGGVPAPHAQTRKPVAAEPMGENETLQETGDGEGEEQEGAVTPVKRPSAPTPKKASAQPSYESPAPSRPASRLTPRPPTGPRPAVSRGSSHAGDSSALGTPTPAIVLQEATPTKDMPPPSIIPSRPTSAMASSENGGGPISPLNVPQVQDEMLQHFFNEVAAQLNTMNIRSSVASAGSSSSSAILGSDYHTYLSYINAGAGSSPSPSPSPSPIQEETMDANQFADADDDDTEAASIHSAAMSISTAVLPPPQHSPLVGLGLGGPPAAHAHGARPGLFPAPGGGVNTNRWSYASSASSNRGASVSSYPSESPALYSPAINWAEGNSNGNTPMIPSYAPSPQPQYSAHLLPHAPHPHAHQGMQAQRAPPPPPPRTASRAPPPRPVNTALANTFAPPRPSGELPRDDSFVLVSHADTPSVEWASQSSRQSSSSSRAQDAFGMLKKKKKPSAIDPVAYSPSLAGPSSALSSGSASGASAFGFPATPTMGSGPSPSPKRSWFGNLFSFKPAAATLVSHQGIAEARDAVRRVLGELGVRVAVVEMDGMRGLKCRYDDVVGATGQITIKGVRFRVEFARSQAPSSQTIISLTQEKGAQSSFRNIYHSLKASIEDGSTAPAPVSILQTSTQAPRRPAPLQTHVHSSYLSPVSPGIKQGMLSPTSASASVSASYPHGSPQAAPLKWANSAPNTPVVPSTPRFQASPSPQPPRSPRVPVSIR